MILDFHIMVTSNHLPVRYAQDTHCVNISCPSGLLLSGSYVFISYSYEYNQPLKRVFFSYIDFDMDYLTSLALKIIGDVS